MEGEKKWGLNKKIKTLGNTVADLEKKRDAAPSDSALYHAYDNVARRAQDARDSLAMKIGKKKK
jgi:hypothetical protein